MLIDRAIVSPGHATVQISPHFPILSLKVVRSGSLKQVERRVLGTVRSRVAECRHVPAEEPRDRLGALARLGRGARVGRQGTPSDHPGESRPPLEERRDRCKSVSSANRFKLLK